MWFAESATNILTSYSCVNDRKCHWEELHTLTECSVVLFYLFTLTPTITGFTSQITVGWLLELTRSLVVSSFIVVEDGINKENLY